MLPDDVVKLERRERRDLAEKTDLVDRPVLRENSVSRVIPVNPDCRDETANTERPEILDLSVFLA